MSFLILAMPRVERPYVGVPEGSEKEKEQG